MDMFRLAAFPVSDVSKSGLVISAVWNRNKLSIFPLWRIPPFQVKLSNRCIIQFSRDYVNYLIWNPEWLIELFTYLQHPFHLVITLSWLAYQELLNLFKLMNSKQPVNVFSMGPCLFAEAWWIASHFNWELFWLQDFALIISSETLLAGGYQVGLLSFEFIHVVLDSLELAVLLEYVLEYNGWRLIQLVTLVLQELYSVLG